MKYKYHAKCSQCGVGWRSNTRSQLLKRMRKHLWGKHKAWMSARIKKGLKKAKKAVGSNPPWFRSIMTGIFPPAVLPSVVADYKAMSDKERSLLKTSLRALTIPIGAEGSAMAELAIRALDKAVE